MVVEIASELALDYVPTPPRKLQRIIDRCGPDALVWTCYCSMLPPIKRAGSGVKGPGAPQSS